MPNYQIHKTVGFWVSISLFIVLAYFYKSIPMQGWKFWLLIPIIVLYSNVPDLDHHLGRLRKYMFQALFLCLALSVLVYGTLGVGYLLAFVTISGIVGYAILNTKHRGIMHTYLFILIVSLPLLYFHWALSLFAFISGSVHILTDNIYSSVRQKVKKVFRIKEKSQFVLFNINKLQDKGKEF
jgi:hypothetical protein